ncbi:NADH dehydrogenase [ubiquinone] 1 alpha subcomplex assembly factor 4-like [Varroa jacobsoni]|nr:NADH dehydrogenase [ubiquinone] 1 alpha subcomplex assembly factor 4-like [Varroa jacobsoni]
MGNALKRIATKPFRSFNIENRARRAIERKKPIQAPRHSGFKDATPPEMQAEVLKKITAKNAALHQRLHDVRVVSEGKNVCIQKSRKLPEARKKPIDPEFGFFEPSYIPKGRISLSKATQLLKKHASDPSKYQASQAASDYNLELKDAQNIIKYFIPMRMLDPDDKESLNKFIEEQKKYYQRLDAEKRNKLPSD